MTELEFRRQPRLSAVANKNKQNKKTKPMKTINKLTIGTLAALTVALLFQTPTTRAGDKGQKDHRDAIITWTKHVTAFLPPGGEIFATIAGTAGGDIGDGTLIGEAFNPREFLPNGFVTFEADYHFNGPEHSFTALVHVEQTGSGPGATSVIIGVVTDGWLKGNVVEGEYTGYSCDQGVAGLCFDGTFVIKKGSKNKD